MEPSIDWIGWGASLVLFLTLGSQLWAQWNARTSEGVSAGLYAGQIIASAGFSVYSYLVGNWVFVVTNVALLLAACGGVVMWRRFAREEAKSKRAESSDAEASDGPDSNDPSAPPKSVDRSMGGKRWTFAGLKRRLTGTHAAPTGWWG